MAGWGIESTATPKEKLKAEMADYLHGLNATGKISYSTYSELFDFSLDLLNKMYDLAKSEKEQK